MSDSRRIVIYDGECGFCSAAVRFIIRHDPSALHAFSPLQCRYAHALMERHDVRAIEGDTLLLVKEGRCYIKSDAALQIARELSGPWRLCWALRVIPVSVRDFLYDAVARHRHALPGAGRACLVPESDVRDRFVGI